MDLRPAKVGSRECISTFEVVEIVLVEGERVRDRPAGSTVRNCLTDAERGRDGKFGVEGVGVFTVAERANEAFVGVVMLEKKPDLGRGRVEG